MKNSDWITLSVGIGSILTTFAGAWIGAYFSGKFASRQSVNSLKLQQKYEWLQKELNESEDNFRLLSQMNTNLGHFYSTVKQTLHYIDSSYSNPKYLIDLKAQINNIIEGISSDGLKVSTKLQRRIISIEISTKNLAIKFELLVSDDDDDGEIRNYVKEDIHKIMEDVYEIQKKVNTEIDKIAVSLQILRQQQKDMYKDIG
ncbi:hypothetical protein ACFWDG_17645 [Peribacillus sp. NPDC060186]